MIPNETLIYERVDEVVYAKYRDPPHNKIPRWIIGGDKDGIDRATAKEQGNLFTYSDWQDINEMAKTHKTLSVYLNKVLNIYLLSKESK
jgi:hypothetical protein|tara:strand:- start:42 stop:308 length:267 start_codon:yes stop_codon:yes gene_type:complete